MNILCQVPLSRTVPLALPRACASTPGRVLLHLSAKIKMLRDWVLPGLARTHADG
jgi:hypothetical protein